MPRDVDLAGPDRASPGIWKEPVDGPRTVRRLNIDGDGQGDLAGHGGEQRAVFVYQLDSYRYWQEYLGRDDFVHGQFGENFTVDGLGDDEVCIGDRYRIGSAVVRGHPAAGDLLPGRHPAGRAADAGAARRRTADPASTSASSRRATVERRRRRSSRSPTGPDADDRRRSRRAALPARRTRPRAPQRALRIPALSPGWQASFRALLESERTGALRPAATPGSTAAGAAAGLAGLPPAAGRREATPRAPTSSSLELEPDDGTPLAAPRPASS